MATILDKIIDRKREEVAERKAITSIEALQDKPLYSSTHYSLTTFLKDPNKTGIIAEHKRKSPSKGIINDQLTVEEVVKGYEAAGASACSVLTDVDFFGGKDEDLIRARAAVQLPLLRKDFIIDEYQITEARSLGANIILLIAACLEPQRLQALAAYTQSLGMEVLLEVHDEEELKNNLWKEVNVIGVNNRNLKDFSVSLNTSVALAKLIPDTYLKVSESGIHQPEDIAMLKAAGFQGFLIGENFMKTNNPGKAMAEFVQMV